MVLNKNKNLHKRKFIGIDNNKDYLDLAIKRFKDNEYNRTLLYFPKEK